MKRFGIVLSLLLIAGAPAFANIYVDGFGAYTQTGDLKNQLGPGLDLAVDVNRNFNIFYRGGYNFKTVNPNKPDEVKYEYVINLLGVQYMYGIKDLPAYWTVSGAMGMSMANVREKSTGKDMGDKGYCIALWTGVLYHATQKISPFLEVGYHKSFFEGDFKKYSIGGFQVLLGIRYAAWGKNKTIESEY